MRILFVLLLVAAVALYLTNPGQHAFKGFVEARAEQFVLERAESDPGGGGPLGQLLSRMAGQVLGQVVDDVTQRTDYYLFSTYTLDLDGPEQEGNEWRFLGIAGQFIELERPEAVRELEGQTGR